MYKRQRSQYRNVFGGQHLEPNPHLVKAIGGMVGLQALVSAVPAARRLLGTTPLGIVDLLVLGGSVLLPLLANEMTKPPAPAALGDAAGGDSDVDDVVEELA